MTIARAAGQTILVSSSSVKPVDRAFAASTVAGNAVVVFVKRANTVAGAPPDDVTVSDPNNASNIFGRVNAATLTDEHRTEIWYCSSLAIGGTMTTRATDAGTNFDYVAFVAEEYTFAGGASVDNNTTSTAASGTAVNTGLAAARLYVLAMGTPAVLCAKLQHLSVALCHFCGH